MVALKGECDIMVTSDLRDERDVNYKLHFIKHMSRFFIKFSFKFFIGVTFVWKSI